MCNAVREQVEQESMREQLTPPPPPKSKAKKGEEVPFKFELPLDKPLCDNTTKEEEGPARPERWRMQQRELVITRKPKVCAAGSDYLNCLILCLITGTRP